MSEKLDRLVSEKVMNATMCETSDQAEAVAKGVPFVVPWYIESDGNARARVWLRAGCDSDTWIIGKWEPSCRIDHAWEVRAEMKRRGFWLLLIDMNDGTWRAAFKSVDSDGRCISSNECVAICLAALRAVGVPDSEIHEALR